MPERSTSPNSEEGQILLEKLWKQVLDESENISVSDEIYTLINSQYVSIRYCLPTQLLGKLIDSSLDCLSLQKGDDCTQSSWDPRSFCNKTIVPWVSENHSVLGTSTDPYVSKPLRRPRLEASPGNVKGAEQWKTLYTVLEEVERKNDHSFLQERMIETLRTVKLLLSELIFEYFVPERISIEQTLKIIKTFLSESSGGDRGLAVAAALFETLGKYLNLYSSIKRYMINAADSATGTSGDIECYGQDGVLKLSIEVKERNLTLTDVRSAINKVRRVSLKELLFNAPGSHSGEEQEIQELIDKTWASGTNLYRLSIEEIMTVSLCLTGEEGRIYFLKKVGEQIDTYNTQPINRKRWKELLESL